MQAQESQQAEQKQVPRHLPKLHNTFEAKCGPAVMVQMQFAAPHTTTASQPHIEFVLDLFVFSALNK
jgi:hypothetical protein